MKYIARIVMTKTRASDAVIIALRRFNHTTYNVLIACRRQGRTVRSGDFLMDRDENKLNSVGRIIRGLLQSICDYL